MTVVNRIVLLVCCAIAALCLSQASATGRSDCQEAISGYNSARSDISSTLRRYTTCASNSNGRDDCSSEFRRLKNAQSDFENAVSNYVSGCD